MKSLFFLLIPVVSFCTENWEECLGLPPVSTYCQGIRIEMPEPFQKGMPQKIKLYRRNTESDKKTITGALVYEYLGFWYPISFETSIIVQEKCLNHYTIPDCVNCIDYIFERLLTIKGEQILKPEEEAIFSIYGYIPENLILLHFPIIMNFAFFGEIGYSCHYYKEISFEDRSCFKKEINPQYTFWEPDEEGEVEIKLKNNCNKELYPAFDKSLYLEFWSRFDIIDLIETNAKGWEKKENGEIDFYFDHLKLGEEWYAKIKVKAKEFPGLDYSGEEMFLYLVNEEDKNNGYSTEEYISTFIYACPRRR